MSDNQNTVVAIGNFDGVHLGHASLLAHASQIADDAGLPLVVLTFEPHPRSFFNPKLPPFRLTPEKVKERILKQNGADRVDVLDFNEIMAALTATQFVDMVICGHANAAHVVVGADFCFGAGREGNVQTLKSDARFATHAIDLASQNDMVVSSTRIREALKAGDMAAASAMLGWPWEIEGPVIRGDARGRTIGYPTANIPLHDVLVPAYGVYAVRIDVGDGVWRMGAASIGIRPTYRLKKPLLEVYILDFDADIYDAEVRVRMLERLRPEVKFPSLEALKAGIADDVAQVRARLT